MALIYDEIRGWIVADDKPDNPPMEASRPTLEDTYRALDKLEQGLIDKDYNQAIVQSVGKAIRGHVAPCIITDCSNFTDYKKDEKNP